MILFLIKEPVYRFIKSNLTALVIAFGAVANAQEMTSDQINADIDRFTDESQSFFKQVRCKITGEGVESVFFPASHWEHSTGPKPHVDLVVLELEQRNDPYLPFFRMSYQGFKTHQHEPLVQLQQTTRKYWLKRVQALKQKKPQLLTIQYSNAREQGDETDAASFTLNAGKKEIKNGLITYEGQLSPVQQNSSHDALNYPHMIALCTEHKSSEFLEPQPWKPVGQLGQDKRTMEELANIRSLKDNSYSSHIYDPINLKVKKESDRLISQMKKITEQILISSEPRYAKLRDKLAKSVAKLDHFNAREVVVKKATPRTINPSCKLGNPQPILDLTGNHVGLQITPSCTGYLVDVEAKVRLYGTGAGQSSREINKKFTMIVTPDSESDYLYLPLGSDVTLDVFTAFKHF